MENESTFFSFFSYIKDKINSLISSVPYYFKQDTRYLTSITHDKIYQTSTENNDMAYLFKMKSKKNDIINHLKKYKNNFNRSYSLNDDSNVSLSLTELSSKEDFSFNENELKIKEEFEDSLINIDSDIEGEKDFKNYYRNNSSFLGQKLARNYFNENFNLNLSKENNSNYDIQEKIKNVNMHSKIKRSKKVKKTLNKRKTCEIKQEMNMKDIRRLNNEYFSYKKQLKLKNKINNNFLKRLKSNVLINSERITKEEKNKNSNKHPFDNLSFTHPERFSLYSTQKKMKLEKKESKKNKENNLFSISLENNININPISIKSNINQKNNSKIVDKNSGILNISPVKSCEINKIDNLSSDFSFKECNDIKNQNDINLSKLIDDSNTSSCIQSTFGKYNISNEAKDINNNIMPNINNDSLVNINKNNNQDTFMDIDECYKTSKKHITNNKEQNNLFPITTYNNPFLKACNHFEKNKEPNQNKKENNINSNNISDKAFFQGKNLFNANGINNNGIKDFNFSLGKK